MTTTDCSCGHGDLAAHFHMTPCPIKVQHLRIVAKSPDHPSSPDMLMARALGVCWHPPTSDRWPCTAR